VADSFAGVTFVVRESGGLVPLPASGDGIAKYARGELRLASITVYNSLAALKSKVSVREIPWRNTVVVDVGAGPGEGTLTWLGTAYTAILKSLSNPRTDVRSATTVLVDAEFLIVTT